ncbi:glycosyltransferase family 2 protein [Gottfriedia acidiceleris]|uniref:glycosyltransferase family 2 protein n=1 Tax=Gottfriedia acidiceleris TaxID=371036 RepID=UPI003D1FC789
MKKIAAIVITYNPNGELFENIRTYANQVELVIIVDNGSNFETDIYFKELKKIFLNLIVIKNNSNFGISKALNIGIKKAIEMKMDFIITFDQDSKAPINMLKNIQDKYLELSKFRRVGIIGPTAIEEKYKDCTQHIIEDISNVSFLITSGSFVEINVFEDIGFFNEEFFIYHVDSDFCFRVLEQNYEIIKLNNVYLYHNDGNKIKIRIFGKSLYVNNYSNVRHYYSVRNLLYLTRFYYRKFPKQILKFFIGEILDTFKILLFESEKLTKIFLKIRGIQAYLKNEKGIMKS